MRTIAIATFFVSLLGSAAYASKQADIQVNDNRDACVTSGGLYASSGAQPRCKCRKQGMINGWRLGNESQAADICVPDPKANKGPKTPRPPKVEKPKAPAPITFDLKLDPEETKSLVSQEVQLTASASGVPKGRYLFKVVCENCLVKGEGGEEAATTKRLRVRDSMFVEKITIVAKDKKKSLPAIVSVTMVDRQRKDHEATAKIWWEVDKTPCQKSGGEDVMNDHCACPAGKDEVQVDGKWICKDHVPTACEVSEGRDLPDGHCECLKSGRMEGKVNGKFVCVDKPKPIKVVKTEKGEKGDRGEPGGGVYAHLAVGGRMLGIVSPTYRTTEGFAYVGGILGITERLELDAMFAIGGPGAKRTDADGQPIANENGKVRKFPLSGIIEAGVGYWFIRNVGARATVIFNPIGITDGLKFLHAGIGLGIGPQFRWILSPNAALLVVPQFLVVEHLKANNGPSDAAVGGGISIGFSFFNYGQLFEKD